MPVKVLLRGFAPDIPEDQPVTFSNDLPRAVLCFQCDNVSSKLYKDPVGHSYCISCVGMCTTEDGFNCSTCDRNFDIEKLNVDASTQRKLSKEMLICPNSTPSDLVKIPFSALKAHLNGCCCKSGSGDLNRGKQVEGIRHKAANQEPYQPKSVNKEEQAQPNALNSGEPAQPSSFQSLQVSVCSVCKETMPKKLIKEHITLCLKGLQQRREHFLQCEGSVEPEDMRNQIGQPSKDFEASLVVTEVAGTPSSMDHLVNVLQNEIKELKQVINEKNNDIELLKDTVAALQEDMRGVQIRCENRIAKAEQSSMDLETHRALLEEFMAPYNEEQKKEIELVHASMANMHAQFEERMEVVDKLQQRIDEFFAQPQELSHSGPCATQ